MRAGRSAISRAVSRPSRRSGRRAIKIYSRRTGRRVGPGSPLGDLAYTFTYKQLMVYTHTHKGYSSSLDNPHTPGHRDRRIYKAQSTALVELIYKL